MVKLYVCRRFTERHFFLSSNPKRGDYDDFVCVHIGSPANIAGVEAAARVSLDVTYQHCGEVDTDEDIVRALLDIRLS